MSNEDPGVGGTVPEPDVGDDDERRVAPVLLPPPQLAGTPEHLAPPQHTGTVHQGTAPQHAGTVHHGAAPQHAGSPLQPPQSGTANAVQHAGHQTPGSADQLAQHPHSVDHAAQHATSSPQGGAPQHIPAPGGGPEAAASQHAAPHLQAATKGGPWRQLKALRHARPRLYMGVVGGAAAAAAVIGAIVAMAVSDEQKPARPAAAETTVAVPVTTAAAPIVVATTRPARPATTPATTPPATEAPTTTGAPTTTVAALPSGAGDYTVNFGDFTVNGGGISASVPVESQVWSFTGACDGVGDCSISAAGEAVLSTGAVGSIFSGPGGTIGLVAAGNGVYTSTFTIDVAECGTATANITMTVLGGTLTGVYDVIFPGSGVCPLTSVNATFSGGRA